jgi:hypothetical protein
MEIEAPFASPNGCPAAITNPGPASGQDSIQELKLRIHNHLGKKQDGTECLVLR